MIRKGMKTKKSAKKRFKISARGKVICHRPGKRHLLGHKSSKQKRRLSGAARISETHEHHITDCLPFNHRG